MKIKHSIIAFLTLIYLNAQVDRPKLVVGIIVDQMRAEYLYRFQADYGEGGFVELMNNGFNFKNTHFNYMPTYTAPGHSSVYTGTTPNIHGIVGNSWYHKSEGKKVYCTADDNMLSIGDISPNSRAGKMSPNRLKTTTITDELKLSTNEKAKIIGISIKDRGAILPAGHMGDAAYWMDKQGKFITSSFYMDKLPVWVDSYNNRNQAQKYIKQGWNLLKPINYYDESTIDNSPYERVFKPKSTPTFPYDLEAIAKLEGNRNIIKSTPFGNNMVAELSKEAIKNERLGKGESTDFIAISFSSTDYVGHSFAPRSIEIQDTYLRLDETLADFIKFLNKEVGEGKYLLFLTADHAAAENPKYLFDRKYHVKSLDREVIKKDINSFIKQKYGENIFVNYSNQNIFLNELFISENNLPYNKIVESIKKHIESKPYVSKVYTRDQLMRGNLNDYHLTMIARGFDSKQNGDLIILLDPQYMEYSETGTTHGSTYMYDTHVPNLWYGWNVPKGESSQKRYITEIAPSISQMLNITIPNGSKGDVLPELFD